MSAKEMNNKLDISTTGKRIAKDSVILTISKVLTSALSIGLTMILSRYRTEFEYGTYSSMILVINLLASLLMLGLPNSVSFFLGRSECQKEKKDFLSVYYSLNTVLTIACGCLLLLLIIPIELYLHNDTISNYWYFLFFYPWILITLSSMENLLVAGKKTKIVLIFNLARSIFVISIAVICYVYKFSFHTYLIAFLISEGVFALMVYALAIWIGGGISFHFSKKLIKSIFAFSIPLGLASALGTLTIECDKFIVGRFVSTEELAIYSNAAKELPITMLVAAITGALLPQLSLLLKKHEYSLGIKIWSKSIAISLSIICLFAFGCFAYAEDVITLLYSNKYIAGANIFRVYCLLLPIRCTYWGIILNSIGKPKYIFYSSLLTLVLNIVLDLSFFFLFGMIGCAIATIISTIVISIAQIIWTSKVTSINIFKELNFKRLLVILFINILFAIVFYRFKELLPLEKAIGSLLESIVLGLIWTVLYVPFIIIILKNSILFKKQ